MLLPRKMNGSSKPPYFLPCLLGMVTVIFLCGEFATAQSYNEHPPRYNYDNLPKTGFTCQGKLPGRYYPDPETDCQMFHVCVKMNNRDVKGFRFLCPNGTVFDAEHQVCIDYYQVVCHTDVGTNPLGHIFEIYKLSSDQGSRDLDIGKLSFVNPDSIEKNTLGDDFQVEEYNNNRLASSQNAINFRASQRASTTKPSQSSQRTGKSNKQKEDIFFGNKGFGPSAFDSFQQPSSTRRPVTTSTTTTTTTEAPSSSTPRRPSLETFESYETESFSGFIPTRNSFGRGQDPTPDFDSSAEDFTTKDDVVPQFKPTQRSTTARPFVFQNTFRTTLSHLPSTSRPNIPAQQTFQQQPTRFNDEYFTKLPSTTRRPVSKAAQFFLHSTNADDYFTPEYRQPTVNPFLRNQQPRSTTTTTTIRPSVIFQSNSGNIRHDFGATATPKFKFETTPRPSFSTTTTTEVPTTTEYFGRYRMTEDDFEARQTTTYNNNDFTKSGRNSNFFAVTKEKEEFGGRSTPTPKTHLFPPQLSTQYVEEETLRPRSIHGSSNPQNSLNNNASPVTIVDTTGTSSRTWELGNFGFSTVPPPTTAEPFSTPPPTTAESAVTQQETAQTLAARLQSQLFKKTTTKNPEKFAIFFGRGTTPSAGNNNGTSSSQKRKRVRSTTAAPFDLEHISPTTETNFEGRKRFLRVNLPSSTIAPDVNAPLSSSSQKPLRRGVRRRVRPGKRPEGKEFDPQLKYQRRRFESARLDGDGLQKNDEIFNAEASVFRGDPSLNNFFQDNKKQEESGSNAEKNDDQKQGQKQRQPVNEFGQFYGRRVRPNAGGDINNEGRFNNGSAPQNNLNNGEGIPGPQIRRRVVKRIRPKTTTIQPETGAEDGLTTKKQFVVTGSTLRPVTRINVKTKLGGKVSTTYRTTEITEGSSSSTPSSTTTTTTEEPELVTASEDEVKERRHHHEEPSPSTPRQPSFPDLKKQRPSNDSHLVIKVLEKPFSPSPSISSSPFSIKKPILSSPKKFSLKPASQQQSQSAPATGTKKSQAKSENDEESHTRSPDYDYAYYNTDDGSDYDAETSNLDHKNYGKKPRNQGQGN